MCTRRGTKKTSAGHSCDLVLWKRFLGVCLVSVKPAPLPWRRPPKAPPRRSACCRKRHFGTLDARPRPQVSELRLRPTAHTTENTRPVLTATESDPGSREQETVLTEAASCHQLAPPPSGPSPAGSEAEHMVVTVPSHGGSAAEAGPHSTSDSFRSACPGRWV